MDYHFHGNVVDYVTFQKWVSAKHNGECPFCGRTGLSNRFGNLTKHLFSCKDNPKNSSGTAFRVQANDWNRKLWLPK